MTLLIATDEAGYGPRLGPLVVVATAWRLDANAALSSAHSRLQQPIVIEPYGELRIDDSKRIFRRKKTARSCDPAPTAPLDLLTEAAAAWIAAPRPSSDYRRWLAHLAPTDLAGLARQPWFAALAAPQDAALQDAASPAAAPAVPTRGADRDAALDPLAEPCRVLLEHWSGGGLQLIGIAARIIDAACYNRLLDDFGNKANLLSHSTCELAVELWRRHEGPTTPHSYIYSDRHGGRAFYGALLQHHCPELNMRVIDETAQCSVYQLGGSGDSLLEAASGSIRWRFTVGGDGYPPVALSSIIAKSTREQLMNRFNNYFLAEAAAAPGGGGVALRPTAGYGVDATRFLSEIESIRNRHSLADTILVRRK